MARQIPAEGQSRSLVHTLRLQVAEAHWAAATLCTRLARAHAEAADAGRGDVAAHREAADRRLRGAVVERARAAATLSSALTDIASVGAGGPSRTTVEARRVGGPPTLRKAISYIETSREPDRAAELTVVDIARAVCVTPRALQHAFRRHLDTTPMAYLRRVRLDRARAELRDADPATATVTAIAARWGFTSSGLSRHYRAAYGERPSETLRR